MGRYARMHACMHVCMHACGHACVHAHVCLCMRVRICVCKCICTHACINAFMYACTRACVHIITYALVYAFMYCVKHAAFCSAVGHLHGRPVLYVGAHASWSPGAGVIVAAARNQRMFKRALTYAQAGLFIALSSLRTPLCKQHTQHFAVQALAD